MHHHRDNDIVSGILHAIGIGCAIAALVLMIVFSAIAGDTWKVVATSIFGTGLILLYTASALYHLFPIRWVRAKQLFRTLDYSMIFVLIAATYTPLCLTVLRGGWGWSIFGIIWLLAITGVVLKISSWDIPQWIYIGKYVLMGWLILIAILPLIERMPQAGLFWLVLGGVLYTLGVLFFALDGKVGRMRYFGMHEIFHSFVLAGSFSHFWMVLHFL